MITFYVYLLVIIAGSFTNGCNSVEWTCKDGQCITAEEKCDGVSNCDDKSDETSESCIDNKCPVYAFRCAYGACVSGKAKCNGIKNCADNSDESPLICSQEKDNTTSGNCPDNGFQCDSGECIDSDEICDGQKSCSDGSDETAKYCAYIKCPSFAFRCHYGGCIGGKSKCNGVVDCHDGSDESAETCSDRFDATGITDTNIITRPNVIIPDKPNTHNTPQKPRQGACILQIPANMEVSPNYDPSRILRDGDFVNEFQGVISRCKPGFTLFGNANSFCTNGTWYGFPECDKTCDPTILKGVTFKVHCKYKGVGVSCTAPIRAGTQAIITCEVGYREPANTTPPGLLCHSHGNWDTAPYRCEAVCGKERGPVTAFIYGGEATNISSVPWHAAIYQRIGISSYAFICGGTIISAKLIVTAAHCFEKDRDNSKYAAAVGKVFREYNAKEPEQTQFFNVSEIHIPESYVGPEAYYYNDIAIVVLNNFIRYKDHIRPICIKWNGNGYSNQVEPETKGLIAGWGRTENKSLSDFLKSIELPVVSKEECKSRARPEHKKYITDEKFCVASSFDEGATCDGDSGGGFVVPDTVKNEVVYFLTGIVSLGLTKESCGQKYFVTFTNIQHHRSMLIDFEVRYREM